MLLYKYKINTRSKGVGVMNTEQIAKLANVSRSTVSRVLNNYSNVPSKTREKVQAVIDEYGYTPNHFARSLAGASSNIVGIFIADINDTNSSDEWIGINSPYNMELLSSLISLLKEKGYIALVNIITDPKEFSSLKEMFETKMIFGGIFTGFPHRTKELVEISQKYNSVFIDQFSEIDDKNNYVKIVNCDNLIGGYEATKYLIENGHTNILHIEGDERLSSIKRKVGYLQAMNDFGGYKTQIITGHYKEDVAYKAMNDYLKENKPTAVFAGNDIMSLGAIKAITDNGYKIPEDISIIGFDNLKVANWLNLNLTTFDVSLKEVAKSCLKQLFSDDAKHLLHKPELVEKATVKRI